MTFLSVAPAACTFGQKRRFVGYLVKVDSILPAGREAPFIRLQVTIIVRPRRTARKKTESRFPGDPRELGLAGFRRAPGLGALWRGRPDQWKNLQNCDLLLDFLDVEIKLLKQ